MKQTIMVIAFLALLFFVPVAVNADVIATGTTSLTTLLGPELIPLGERTIPPSFGTAFGWGSCMSIDNDSGELIMDTGCALSLRSPYFITVTPGNKYLLSVDLRRNQVATVGSVSVGVYINGLYTVNVTGLGENFTKYSFIVTIPSGATFADPHITNTSGRGIRVDNISFRDATTALQIEAAIAAAVAGITPGQSQSQVQALIVADNLLDDEMIDALIAADNTLVDDVAIAGLQSQINNLIPGSYPTHTHDKGSGSRMTGGPVTP